MNLSKEKMDFILPVEQAKRIISETVSPLSETEKIPLKKSLFRVLAEDVISPINVPADNNAAMDGYAFSAEHLDLSKPVTLKIAGSSFAGHPFKGVLSSNECVRIMTGAFMPTGLDTVIQQENVQVQDDMIVLPANSISAGENVRLCGEDIKAKTVCQKKGTLIGPASMGVLASVGMAEIHVIRRPKVAIFTTGDELYSVENPVSDNGIYDSNRYSLYGMLKRLGCEIMDMGIVRDDPDQIKAAFLEAHKKADVIITTGGVSVGSADYTGTILAQIAEIDFWNINMRPGRPTVFGQIKSENKNTYIFGLPGNPVAVMVAFYFFVRDALFYLMGTRPAPLPRIPVKSISPLSKRQGRTEFQRGILSPNEHGEWVVRTTGSQGSGMLSSMTQANCMIVLPAESKAISPGETVEVVLFEGLV